MCSGTLKDRVAGTVFGQFLGDAFGTTYEFSSSQNAKCTLKANADANGFIPIVGEGPFCLVAGQVTDDTELAMGLADAVINFTDVESLWKKAAQNYIKWYQSNPFDIGTTTRGALCGLTPEKVRSNAKKKNQASISNGCLMRSFSLGILGYKLSEELMEEVIVNDCTLTNPNPVAIDAVRVQVFALRSLLKHGKRVVAYKEALRVCKTDAIKLCLEAAEKSGDKIPCEGEIVKTDSYRFQGYVGVAIQNGFYELLNGKSFYQSMLDIVSRGGDTDTTGCIAGALLGAYYGKDNLPKDWIETVKKCNNPRTAEYDLIDHSKMDDLIQSLYDLVE